MAISLGIGSMVSAGIFALMGEAAALAGSAVWFSFLMAGIIALLTGHSFVELGVRYPTRGGIVEYLVRAYGVGIFSGGCFININPDDHVIVVAHDCIGKQINRKH